ncbi:MAG: AraC family transcriptional regulator [Acidimicrobiia bacterium]|nr:AraC family transcriptional regulator [Acidimicrobiia bacterium]
MNMYEIESKTLSEQPTVVVRGRVKVSDIGDWLGPAYAAAARVAGAAIAGLPFGRYQVVEGDPPAFDVEAGFPVATFVEGSGEVEAAKLPGGLVAVTWHRGPYDGLELAHKALTSWLRQHGARAAGEPWEVYYTDPMTDPDPMAWRTEVIQPYS